MGLIKCTSIQIINFESIRVKNLHKNCVEPPFPVQRRCNASGNYSNNGNNGQLDILTSNQLVARFSRAGGAFFVHIWLKNTISPKSFFVATFFDLLSETSVG